MMSDSLAFLGGYHDYEEGEDRGYGNALNLGMRDIDPSLLVTRTHYDGWAQWEQTWWLPVDPKLQSISPAERIAWLDSDRDVVSGEHLIDITNPKTKKRWICLHGFSSWRQHGILDDREEFQRDTWFRLDCFVVKQKNLKKAIRDLSKQTLTDSHKLPRIESHGDHFLGEYPWHSSVKKFGDWTMPSSWYSLSVPARATVADYLCERSGYDYSIDDTINLQLPAPWLAKALNLKLSDGRRLNYVDASGNVIFFDPSVDEAGPQAALVDRGEFLAMLEREDLAAVWVIAGEKNVYGGRDSFGGRRLHTAIYHLDGDNFQHQMHWERADPSFEQLQALFAPEKVPAGLTSRSEQLSDEDAAEEPKRVSPKRSRRVKTGPNADQG